jgi:hypothetical protein
MLRAMSVPGVLQGRVITAADLDQIRTLQATQPTWSRRQLSVALATAWDWRTSTGRLKDMAARTLLGKLEARGLITLPARRRVASNRMAVRSRPLRTWDLTPLIGSLRAVGPVTVTEVSGDADARAEVAAALTAFHYLGARGTVGENLQYTVRDPRGRLLACLRFGSAAWSCRARDTFIGWTAAQRAQRLTWVTNNTRFLILPGITVAHLASWTLGHVLRRVSADWQQKYGHPILLVETFVDRARFAGTSYRAANWQHLGATTGRSRQDRYTTLRVPIKDVYGYPLHRAFRAELCA